MQTINENPKELRHHVPSPPEIFRRASVVVMSAFSAYRPERISVLACSRDPELQMLLLALNGSWG